MPVQRLKEWMYRPYQKMMQDHPHVALQQPFQYVHARLYVNVRALTVRNIVR